jgi:hypothetical protein
MTIFQKIDIWMQTNIAKSWKTTVIGLVGGTYILVRPYIESGAITEQQIVHAVLIVGAGMVMKDFNVTGTPKTPEVK